jgi:hypothetical protein
MDKNGGNLQSLFGGLLCHQVVADHFLSKLFDFLWCFNNLNSTLQATGKMTYVANLLPLPRPPAWTCALRISPPSGSNFLAIS